MASPRQSIGNHVLPIPKKAVSTLINHQRQKPEAHEGLTSISGVWSELIYKDIASTVHPSNQQNLCCSGKTKYPECYEIRDEQGGCINYLRSVPSLTVHKCNFESREQMNGASAYLDGSHIYGATDEQLHRLRTYSQGKVDISVCKVCNNTVDKALAMIYTALLNEHNRLTEKLAEANEQWDDTKLFLEARRLVVAQIQHITLNEYVPSILGEGARTDPELMPVASGFYSGYSSSNVGGTYDAVALAALHALTSLRKQGIDDAMCLENHVVASANRVNLDLSGSGFESRVDVDARFVHVGRDHGIPGYVRFVADCPGNNVTVGSRHDVVEYYTDFILNTILVDLLPVLDGQSF